MQKHLLTVALGLLFGGCSMTQMSLSDNPDNAKQSTEPQLVADKAQSGQSPYAVDRSKEDILTPAPNAQGQDSTLVPVDPMYYAKDLAPVDLSRFYGKPTDKNITHYVRGIMHDLVDNLHYVNEKTPIGVTNFVFIDGAFDKGGLLSNQIVESFIHEVHQFGIPVIDYKTTDYIRVTPQGDFIFSRDYLDLKEDQPIKYVLAGTLAKHRAGYLVNARIIGFMSKAEVASAQGFIPDDVAEGLMPSGANGGVMLTQGE